MIVLLNKIKRLKEIKPNEKDKKDTDEAQPTVNKMDVKNDENTSEERCWTRKRKLANESIETNKKKRVKQSLGSSEVVDKTNEAALGVKSKKSSEYDLDNILGVNVQQNEIFYWVKSKATNNIEMSESYY